MNLTASRLILPYVASAAIVACRSVQLTPNAVFSPVIHPSLREALAHETKARGHEAGRLTGHCFRESM